MTARDVRRLQPATLWRTPGHQQVHHIGTGRAGAQQIATHIKKRASARGIEIRLGIAPLLASARSTVRVNHGPGIQPRTVSAIGTGRKDHATSASLERKCCRQRKALAAPTPARAGWQLDGGLAAPQMHKARTALRQSNQLWASEHCIAFEQFVVYPHGYALLAQTARGRCLGDRRIRDNLRIHAIESSGRRERWR